MSAPGAAYRTLRATAGRAVGLVKWEKNAPGLTEGLLEGLEETAVGEGSPASIVEKKRDGGAWRQMEVREAKAQFRHLPHRK